MSEAMESLANPEDPDCPERKEVPVLPEPEETKETREFPDLEFVDPKEDPVYRDHPDPQVNCVAV